MNSAKFPPSHHSDEDEQIKEDDVAEKLKKLQLFLPMENPPAGVPLYLYKNYWCPSPFLTSVVSTETHFQSQVTDIVLVSKPKSGTTWLKALAFSIINRKIYPPCNQDPSNPHPLLRYNPHQLVEFMEIKTNSNVHLKDNLAQPRLLATHIPYHALSRTMMKSECRIIYICRNVLDAAISLWFFILRSEKQQSEDKEHNREDESRRLEHFLDYICKGVESYGPHWDHVLGYWHESLRRRNKVLFLKYEDMKEDEMSEIMRLAEFMGFPFSHEEKESGTVEAISKLCSTGSLKEVEVNKIEEYTSFGKRIFKNNMFFRKGEVGDWVNHVNPSTAERLERIVQEKLQGSGLHLRRPWLALPLHLQGQ